MDGFFFLKKNITKKKKNKKNKKKEKKKKKKKKPLSPSSEMVGEARLRRTHWVDVLGLGVYTVL